MPTISTDLLAGSYKHCRQIARRRAKNFYYSFLVLPKEKSDGMCAVYAFMRYCDDIADDPDINLDRGQMLEAWRRSLDKALGGDYGDNMILPAFHDALKRFDIPAQYFHDLIDGAEMDLTIDSYSTFQQLYSYCYRVASVVGLVCIHILGFSSPEAKKYAEYCGIAFQLTNILRDMKEDAVSGRVYIPQEDLASFNYSHEDILNSVQDERFTELMRFQVKRARTYYNAAGPLVPLVDEVSRPGLCAMMQIYSGILDRIEDADYDVYSKRVSLSKAAKLSIAAGTLIRSKFNGGLP